jgi:CheY-like chemotaxis protein
MKHAAPLDLQSRPTVLLAEDDPDQSDMLREVLEDEGYHVETAFSGDVAYQKLLDKKYDLIMLDIRMPGLNGGTVLKALRQRNLSPHVPVIVVTAFATEPDMLRYHADGADACVSKPYDMSELVALVERLAPARGLRP